MRKSTATFFGTDIDEDGMPTPFYRFVLFTSAPNNPRDFVTSVMCITRPTVANAEGHYLNQVASEELAERATINKITSNPLLKSLKLRLEEF